VEAQDSQTPMAMAIGDSLRGNTAQGEQMAQRSYLNMAAFRNCIHEISDQELIGFGRVCRSLAYSTHAVHTASFDSTCAAHFSACKQEWKRRHARAAS
jgi:hypothetical protein